MPIKKEQQVIFIESTMLKRLPPETKESLLEKITSLGYKVYTSDTVNNLLRLKKTKIHRFGFIPDRISSSVKLNGCSIVPGDF